jgi:hypothetical protein
MDQNMSMLAGPVVLLTGCALMALGGLSFFGVDFFKSKTRAIAALVGGLVLVVMMEIAFMADSGGFFFQAQKIYVSQCYIEGETVHPEAKATKDNAAGQYISQCVSKIGYEWSPEHYKCREYLVPMNAFCYLPTDPISRAVTKVQLLFEQ